MVDKLDNEQSYIKENKNRDLDERTVYGTFIYFAAWIIIGWGVDFHKEQWSTFLVVSIFLLIFSLLRVAYFQITKRTEISNNLRGVARSINILVPALTFGLLLAFSMVREEYQALFLYLLMTIFALLSTGAVNFSPDKNLSYAFLGGLTIPSLIAVLFLNTDKSIEGIMLALYGFYMLFLANRLSSEYDTRVKQQFALALVNREDSLTGLANRRFFDSSLVLSWKNHSRSQLPLSLILIDIDFFKRVNDTYGHPGGDFVIIEMAKQLQLIFQRETDVIARIGGEEYAVILSNCPVEQALVLAESARKNIESHSFEYDGHPINCTISIGVASCTPSINGEPDSLILQADERLYVAKRSGRNRIVSSG